LPMKPAPDKQTLLRSLPSIQDVLVNPVVTAIAIDPRYLTPIIREELNAIRVAIRDDSFRQTDILAYLLKKIESRSRTLLNPSLQRVINASGIVLHTNMGRAPLPLSARQAVREVSENFSNLELNLENGKRGNRQSHCAELLKTLTGAEDAIVVNNCAAAILLALTAICRRKEVPVSRGELVEIGGSFRMPDVMKFSGAKMVEVGTTNKTHLRDYAEAITEKTSALLKVHCSNYRIVGFTKDVSIGELANLAHQHELPFIYDMGSGMMEDMQHLGYPYEPTVRDILSEGVDLVVFSGDKILGGAQSGIVVGKKQWLEKLRKHHLARALRCDKMTLAALEATLRLYLQPKDLIKTLPVAHMLAEPVDNLRRRAEKILRSDSLSPLQIEIVEARSQIGSGAFPLETLPSIALRISGPLSALKIQKALRQFQPPVIGYVQDDALLLNLRTIRQDEDKIVHEALSRLATQST